LREEERRKIFVDILEKYEVRIFNLVYWKVGDYEEAKDLTQDIFIKVYKALPSFRGEAKYYTWIYRIALNHLSRYLKKRKIWSILSLENLRESSLKTSNPEEPISQSSKKLIREKVMNLPSPFRDVVLLYYFDQRSYEEISEILGISQGTVKSRLSRARKILSEWLKDMKEIWFEGG
jgi:RNA polymerase sigma-70 factor (ECF subfamily)